MNSGIISKEAFGAAVVSQTLNNLNNTQNRPAPVDKESFGAAVVSQTLDNLNNTQNRPAPVDKESFGAAVVSQTLDNLNNNSSTYNGADYQFQKDVLSAAYNGKGTIVDTNAD